MRNFNVTMHITATRFLVWLYLWWHQDFVLKKLYRLSQCNQSIITPRLLFFCWVGLSVYPCQSVTASKNRGKDVKECNAEAETGSNIGFWRLPLRFGNRAYWSWTPESEESLRLFGKSGLYQQQLLSCYLRQKRRSTAKHLGHVSCKGDPQGSLSYSEQWLIREH